ncbi:MAG: SH3 domain-containing protein [Gammaproteobacteria bacterium]|nr:SH3 domain-containing protein [Gammaproteobacteria bacterium]
MQLFLKKLLVSVFLLLPAMASAETFYVQSKEAKIYSEKSFKSDVIVTLERGTEIDVSERQGSWAQVMHDKSQGWIPSLLISEDKPVQKD